MNATGRIDVGIRLMRTSDFAFADSLRAAAGWNQTLGDWERCLACAPDGCFVAEINGRLAGTVTTIQYGHELGWVGMMLVAEDQRRQGIGWALLQHAVAHLQDQRVACVKLDATPAGEPVYRKLGFKAECRLTRWETPQCRLEVTSPSASIGPLTAATLREVTRLDRAAVGVAREKLLSALARQSVRSLICHGPDGQVSGFGLLRAGSRACYLGPVIAERPADAATLVRELLGHAGPKPVFWDVFNANQDASDYARELGFKPQRTLTRMFYGQTGPTAQVGMQWAIADPAVG